MAYTEPAEVQQDFKQMDFAAANSSVTTASVEQFIVESDGLINSYIATRYVTPVTAAGAGLDLLKLLSRSLTTARIKKILEVKQAKNTDANQNVVSTLLSPKDVMKILSDLQAGNISLIGAELLTTSSGGFYSKNAANNECPVIKKDQKQW